MTSMKTGLTIAGSDCSGGAGIQADIKTMTTNGVYAMSAITALTAQNTTGVRDILELSPQFLKEQLDCIFTDIRPDAVKIGMVSSTELIEVIAGSLRQYEAAHIVVDPVMVATSGARLIREDAICAMQEKLFKIAEVITPNIPEAELLSGIEIQTQRDMERAAEMIGRQFGCSVLLKGGHQRQDANDLLWKEDGTMRWFYGTRNRESEYSRNRMHAFECDRSQSGERIWIGRVCKKSKAVSFRCIGVQAGSGSRKWADEHAFAWNRNE